ncbi:helix-turn-helix domain-containing protein [Periweissella ghanensis]|uniref:HTH-type transcriptional activator RhaS n=1 Tax=Periweissella ghanensis TaxID=467997 RepID=A0ABM8ZAT0_9LACO|nr:helix-turn-helix domain-containing protein [Periweissella ghanensis]CAH0418403.1 HTH-type transcriptional activator RhaS [Periweissella ghanensis]
MQQTILTKVIILSSVLKFTYQFTTILPGNIRIHLSAEQLKVLTAPLHADQFIGIALISDQALTFCVHGHVFLTLKVPFSKQEITPTRRQDTLHFYRNLIEECYQKEFSQLTVIDISSRTGINALSAVQLPFNAASSRALYSTLTTSIRKRDKPACLRIIRLITESNRDFNNQQLADLPVNTTLNNFLTVSLITILTQVAILADVDATAMYRLSDSYLEVLAKTNIYRYDFITEFLADIFNLPNTTSTHQISLLKHYVQKHIFTKLTVIELASALDISTVQLRRIMKEHLNITPLEYINEQKIAMGRYLLLTRPDLQILEIADMLCFYDSSHFIKEFLHFSGMAPKQFQQIINA